MFKDKKQVKFIALAVALVFLLGVAAVAVTQTTTGMAAAAGGSSNIGVVNHQLLVSQHPDMAKAQEAMQAEVDQARKDFESKAATMNDKEKQDYYMQLQQRLSLKQQELVGPVFDKVNAAIKAVADAKGLVVVLDKSQVIYGGQDITDEVMKKIGAAK